MSFHPYLNFNGNCREAFTRYHEILGGQLDLLSMADLPAGVDAPTDQADLIMHAALSTETGHCLMASDDPTGGFTGVNGMWVNYTVDDTAEAERVFKELSDGGEIVMPIGETFWSPKFGMCIDRFGIPWMVNTAAAEQPV